MDSTTMNRTAQKGITVADKLLIALGMVIAILLLLASIVALLFWATGNTLEGNPAALRWWATIATVIYLPSIVITWRIAKNEARAHLKGFNRGLDGAQDTLVAVGRGLSATASIARASARPIVIPKPRMDDLLPNVGSMRLLSEVHNSDELIEL